MNQPEVKVTVVGAGLSGLTATLKLADAGVKVNLISLYPASASDSCAVRSGLNAPLARDDSVDQFAEELVVCGDLLADASCIQRYCADMPRILAWLQQMGVVFSHEEDGFPSLFQTEGCQIPRTVYIDDSTGAQILQTLDGAVRRMEQEGLVERFEGWEFLQTVRDGHDLYGILAMNHRDSEIRFFDSGSVILCTGGSTSIFENSVQSQTSSGSAASLLFQEGALYANAEFYHLHPTCFQLGDSYIPLGEPGLRLGGRLWIEKDGAPWYFLEDFYPQFGGKVPYLVTNRAIYKIWSEFKSEREPVYLDTTHFPWNDTRSAFLHQWAERVKKFSRIDLQKESIPVCPAFNYSLGGLWVDADHQTSIDGVYAAGECQYLYHGARLMESNILGTSLHGGWTAAEHAVEFARSHRKKLISQTLVSQCIREQSIKNTTLINQEGSESVYQLKADMRQIMTKFVGALRTTEALKEAQDEVQSMLRRYEIISLADKGNWMNQELITARRLKNELELCLLVISCALKREESRGSHFRVQMPNRDDDHFLATSLAKWTPTGPSVDFEPIQPHIKKRVNHNG